MIPIARGPLSDGVHGGLLASWTSESSRKLCKKFKYLGCYPIPDELNSMSGVSPGTRHVFLKAICWPRDWHLGATDLGSNYWYLQPV